MTTQELIAQELSALDENDLRELYTIIKDFMESKRHATPSSLMSKLKHTKIEAPPDFAANLDQYTSGEKSAQIVSHL